MDTLHNAAAQQEGRPAMGLCKHANATVWLAGLILLLASAGIDAKPLNEPVLRLGTDRHTAPIKSVSSDAAGRILLTASYDKTARVWDATTLESIRTLRVPIGPDKEGRLFAGAVRPDGRQVAIGGTLSGDNDNDNETESIYLYDPGNGELLRRLSNLPSTVLALAYSPDGSLLAASLGNGELHFFGTAVRGALHRAVPACGKAMYGLSWSPDGRQVATACDDGFIRLFDSSGTLLKESRPVSTGIPVRSVFSPDGRMLAVAYASIVQLRVLRTADLKPAFTPDLKGIGNGDLSYVAWSTDGSTLYAGGNYDDKAEFPVFAWSRGGQGSRSIAGTLQATISGIVALPDGRVVLTAVDTTIATFGNRDQPKPRVEPVTANLQGAENLQVGEDGRILRLRIDRTDHDARRVLFDLNNANLQALSPQDTGPGDFGLTSASTRSSRLKIELGGDDKSIRLNGQTLHLDTDEVVHSHALLPEDKGVLVGTSRRLRNFDADGRQNWEIKTPANAWAVNISRNGKLAVAAYGDGTVRWYRLQDGAPLLNLFVARDGKHWVAWTPQGYYMANPGGEQFIGWHVNHGRDEAPDFHAAAQLRERFFRPDVVRRVIETLDPQQAYVLAEQARQPFSTTNASASAVPILPVSSGTNGTNGTPATQPVTDTPRRSEMPPVVTLLSPADGSAFDDTHQSLRIRIHSESKVRPVKIFIDGRPLPDKRALTRLNPAEHEPVMDLDLPAHDVEISVIVENEFGASPPATARLQWSGDPDAARKLKPRLFVFAAGVGQYQNQQIPPLTFPPNDAKNFAELLAKQQGRMYRDVSIRVPTIADRAAIDAGFLWLKREVKEGDVVMLMLAGHGVTDEAGRYLFLPRDADPAQLSTTAISGNAISELAGSLQGRVIVFLDTCHSGALRSVTRNSNADRLTIDLTQPENGVIVFSASTGNGFAQEDPTWGNGAFTKALLEGISGKADMREKGEITVSGLDFYVSDRVKELTNGQQLPTTAKPNTIPDFPIALIR